MIDKFLDPNTKSVKLAISDRVVDYQVNTQVYEISNSCLLVLLNPNFNQNNISEYTQEISRLFKPEKHKKVIVNLNGTAGNHIVCVQSLGNIIQLLTLLGLEIIFCGIIPEVAERIVLEKINTKTLSFKSSLKCALKEVIDA
jgi:anti-anti-sigma regulatory factor